jgi:hypothetical protein
MEPFQIWRKSRKHDLKLIRLKVLITLDPFDVQIREQKSNII